MSLHKQERGRISMQTETGIMGTDKATGTTYARAGREALAVEDGQVNR